MCDLTLGLALASTMLGAVGQVQQGNAQARASEYNSQIMDMNAKISERRERDAIDRGQKEEQRKRAEVQGTLGKQAVAMAANGVDLTFGSPLDVMVDTAVMGELDALTIRSNAYREGYDHRVDAVNKRAGATLSRMEGASAKSGGYLSAFGTVLGGSGDAFADYYKRTGRGL